jgi:hypothetical protein
MQDSKLVNLYEHMRVAKDQKKCSYKRTDMLPNQDRERGSHEIF